jgi:carboxypeptidase D
VTDGCVTLLKGIEGEPINVDSCDLVMGAVVNVPGGAEYVYVIQLLAHTNSFCSEKAGLCVNVYDVRLKDEIPACGMNWPYALTNVTSYLRVRSLLPAPWFSTYHLYK